MRETDTDKKSKKECFGRYISITYRYLGIMIAKELEVFNIGMGHFNHLILLFKEDGIHQEKLRKILGNDKGTTARAIRKLEDEGYIYKVTDKNDKRAFKVFLTDKGEALKPIIYRILDKQEEILIDGLKEEEKSLAHKVIKKMAENMFLSHSKDKKEE